MKELLPHITVDKNMQFGKPVIAGTRVPVEIVIGHIAGGTTIEEVMQEYRLTYEGAGACSPQIAEW